MSKTLRSSSRSRKPLAPRESDIISDPVYKSKRSFFNELQTQLDANILEMEQRTTITAKDLKRLITVQISQLSSTVQNMSMEDFLVTYGFDLDGISLKRIASNGNDNQKTVRMNRVRSVVANLPPWERKNLQYDNKQLAISVSMYKSEDGQYMPELYLNDKTIPLTAEVISEMDAPTLFNVQTQIDTLLKTLEDAKQKLHK
ncbi:hypothetical protein WA158_003659 [Blastocystis sp. Blastoise]